MKTFKQFIEGLPLLAKGAMVLEYLFSTEQVSTLEEANYVMMEMDQTTIGGIVKEVKVALSEDV